MRREWWHDKVAYQIYPKSFYDSNGDGIGDLPGIIDRLDYLKDLGVDILWLSPIYRSPLADQGYDISDYYDIDPRFGTMEDMDRLLAEAKKRDMYIVMDLVVNHCSDEHEWFRRACEDPEGVYGQYFYLRKLKKAAPGSGIREDPAADGVLPASGSDVHAQDGSGQSAPKTAGRGPEDFAVCSPDGYVLPCNWRSYFGGPVWEKLPGHEDWFYLHVFHKKQPDLNWENPDLREEIYRMINWWLDKGLAGFRIDAILNIKKALPFANYAPDRADGLCSIHSMLRRAQGVGAFLREMRDRTFRTHGAFTVGEVFVEKEEDLPGFIGEDGYFSSVFDFSEAVWGSSPDGWHADRGITPDEYRQCLFSTQKKIGDIGFISNIIENHDEPRGVSRYIPAADMEIPEEAEAAVPSAASSQKTGAGCPVRPGQGETGAAGSGAGEKKAGASAARLRLRETAKKALATVYFFARGLPWIYQGQEIGMENVPLHGIGEVDDIASLDAWSVMRGLGVPEEEALRAIEKHGRDNARTPFQWSGEAQAGFTTGTPWLRVNPDYPRLNLAQQTADPLSVFRHYQKMIALRKDPRYLETLVYGLFVPWLEDVPNVIAYMRRQESAPAEEEAGVESPAQSAAAAVGQAGPEGSAAPAGVHAAKGASAVLVLSNFQRAPGRFPLPAPVRKVLLNNCPDPAPKPGAREAFLTGYQTLVVELETDPE